MRVTDEIDVKVATGRLKEMGLYSDSRASPPPPPPSTEQGLGKGFAPSADAAHAALGNVRQDKHPGGVKGTQFSLDEMAKAICAGRNDPRMRAWAGQCIARAEALRLARHLDYSAWCEHDKLPQGGFEVRAKTKNKELAKASAGALASAWQELTQRLRGQANTSKDFGVLKNNAEQAQAILEEIRRITYYVQDPCGTELIAKPHVTLCLDDFGLCMPSSDCDDRCVCFASATLSIGIDSRVVGCAYGTKQATHVICAILDPQKGWLKVDPSHDQWPVGRVHPTTKEWWLDPLTGSMSHSAEGPAMTLGKQPDNGDFIGVGAVPFPHAFAPGAQSASYVPVGLESGFPCKPDGTECGTDVSAIVEFPLAFILCAHCKNFAFHGPAQEPVIHKGDRHHPSCPCLSPEPPPPNPVAHSLPASNPQAALPPNGVPPAQPAIAAQGRNEVPQAAPACAPCGSLVKMNTINGLGWLARDKNDEPAF